jgi:hypothetical protein
MSVLVSPSSVIMDVSQSQTFTATVSGGAGPYTYRWYLNGSLIGSNSTIYTYTPTVASVGLDSLYVNVTDSATVPMTAKSNTATVTVYAAPSVSIPPTNVPLDVKGSKLFNSSIVGGASPFSYQWYLNGIVVSGATNSSWLFVPTSSGSFTVCLNVTDGVSMRTKSNTVTVTVNGRLSVTISPTSVAMTVGNSETFNETVSGGTSPYSYQWYINGSAVSNATSAAWAFTPSSVGSYSIYVRITDAAGAVMTSTASAIILQAGPGFPSTRLLALVIVTALILALIVAALILRFKNRVRVVFHLA